MGKRSERTTNEGAISSNKRCKEHQVCQSLKEALTIAESAPVESVSFATALSKFECISSFRVAAVVYVSRLPSYMWDSDAQLESQLELTGEETKVFRVFYDVMDNKCCREGREMIIPSELLKIVQPLMKKFPARKLKNLSSLSDYIEYMIPRVDVNFRGDKGNPDMNAWEAYNEWLDLVMKNIPLLLDILDPAYLVIREAGAAAPTPPVIAALGSIPVAALPNTGANLTVAPVQVTDPNGIASIAGLYRFHSRTEAGNARMALMTWAAMVPIPIVLEIMRFATDVHGLEWF